MHKKQLRQAIAQTRKLIETLRVAVQALLDGEPHRATAVINSLVICINAQVRWCAKLERQLEELP